MLNYRDSVDFAIYFAIPGDISAIFSLLIILFLMKLIIRIIANKTIASVLFDDLNAQEFHRIITSNKYFLPPLSYRINAAFFTGDYQTVVNIASYQLRKKRCSIKETFYYLSLLARTYFELRDFDKLTLLLNKYDEIKKLYPSKKLFNTTNSIWSYYRYFLEGNFEACKTICREKLLELNSKAWDSKIKKLHNDFAYAVACYQNGDTNDAIEYFESIILYAPNMHSSELSIRYVDAIKKNLKITLFSEIVPERNYTLRDKRTTKKTRQYRIITAILLILVCSSIITPSVIDSIVNKGQNQYNPTYNTDIIEYEKKLNNAIAKIYNNANFIKYFNVKDGTQHIDSFCLIQYNDSLDLASIVTYDEGETSDIIILMEDLHINQSYCIKSAVSEYYIGFQIHTSEPKDSILYYIVEFTYNNKNYWFAIDYIGDTPAN